MDPYEQLDLPPSTRQLPTVQQRELLTERYLQLLERTDGSNEQLSLQRAWQYAMGRANEAGEVANRGMGEWIEEVVEDVDRLEIAEIAPSKSPSIAPPPPEEFDGFRIPCPFGHEHVYDDERGGRILLRCPSCRALFSVIVNARARDVRSNQALSAREREWTVVIVDPETSEDTVGLSFRGATTIDLEVGDRFSLASAAGARGDHPLWLVNHARGTRWALSGRGTGVGFFQRAAPAPVEPRTVALIGYVLPAVAVWGVASLTLQLVVAAVVAVLFTVLVWRPFVVPALLPIGEHSLASRVQSRLRR